MDKPNILVNLPASFFKTPSLKPIFGRLAKIGKVKKTSHNAPDEIKKDLAWADAVIMWSWPTMSDELLDQAPKIKYMGHLDISQRGARVALARKLPISTSRHGFSPAVSEMALGLILTSLRRISDYHAQMRAGKEFWIKDFPIEIDPLERELTGRTVGIVGLGQVGGRLRELLEPFHCTVKVYDPFLPDELAKAKSVEKVELKDLMKGCEVIVLCAASNAGTKNLIDAKMIKAMKPGTVFVNVARAALVETDALVERLKKSDIVAAVDVFDQEPLPRNHPLRKLPNALLTPHRAGGLMSSVERILTWLIDDLENALAGKPLKCPVTENMISRLDA
jgi:D-3-phosphoglycerate dehydrogenase / 2-oxoglutarate reductase